MQVQEHSPASGASHLAIRRLDWAQAQEKERSVELPSASHRELPVLRISSSSSRAFRAATLSACMSVSMGVGRNYCCHSGGIVGRDPYWNLNHTTQTPAKSQLRTTPTSVTAYGLDSACTCSVQLDKTAIVNKQHRQINLTATGKPAPTRFETCSNSQILL